MMVGPHLPRPDTSSSSVCVCVCLCFRMLENVRTVQIPALQALDEQWDACSHVGCLLCCALLSMQFLCVDYFVQQQPRENVCSAHSKATFTFSKTFSSCRQLFYIWARSANLMCHPEIPKSTVKACAVWSAVERKNHLTFCNQLVNFSQKCLQNYFFFRCGCMGA